MSVSAPGAIGATATVTISDVPIPANYEFTGYGDSRTEDGIGSTASQTNGYNFGSNNIGYLSWLPTLSGNKLRLGRYPNFGIASSTLAQGAANPRLDATGVASTGRWDRPNGSSNYASNKGYIDAKNHSAGIVAILYGTNWPSGTYQDQLAYTETIMNGIGTGKVILLLNEQPRGISYDGTVQNAASNPAERYTFSRELLKYDFASGDAKARSNVIVINSYDEFLDVSSGTNYYNKQGYLRDGLHDTPYGSKRKAQIIVDRLSAIWPGWASLPAQVTLPTANGLSVPANTQPFIHTNPILTPGTNGAVLGTWGGAPAAANVPQGWTVNALNGGSGLTAVCDKTGTDPDGYPTLQITISGTLAANTTATVQAYQTLASAALSTAISAGLVSINDKFRGLARVQVAAGSAYLAGVGYKIFVQDTTASRSINTKANAGSTGSAGNNGTSLNAYLDAGGTDWQTLVTELIDCQDANLVAQSQNIAAFSQIQGIVEILFRNNTASTQNVSATVKISRAGVWRATN